MSLIDTECTVIDTPSDVRNYAQLGLEQIFRKKCKGVKRLLCFFGKIKFWPRTNRNVGKRGENLVKNTVFLSKSKLPQLYSGYRGKFSDFRTL